MLIIQKKVAGMPKFCLRYPFIYLMKNGYIPSLDRITGNIMTVIAVFTKQYGLLSIFFG